MEVDPGTAGHVDAEAGKGEKVEGGSAVVPDAGLLDRWTPGDQEFPLRAHRVGRIEILLPNIHAIHETCFRHEARAVVEVEALQVQLASGALEVDFVAGPGRVRTVSVLSGTSHGRALDAPVLIDLEIGVHTPHAVEASAEFPVGVDGADGGLIEDVAADAGDGKGGPIARIRIGGRQSLAGGPVVAGQDADSPRARFARQPEAELGMSNAARKHEIDGGREEVAVFEKERPLFGKEDLEALVDRDLRLVGFHLAEIGIHGGIEDEAAMQNELAIQADIGLESAALEERMVRVALVDVSEAAEEPVRNQLHVAGRGYVLQASCRGGLIEAALDTV